MRPLVPVSSPRSPRALSRSRLLVVMFAGIAAMFVLAACGKVDNATEIAADGSGVQTLTVTISESDMERIDGGADTVESTVEASNPGLGYQGMTKNGTDTVFTFTLEFDGAEDYAAKVQPVLAAGDLTKTAEVTFTPPSAPFSSGYTLTRNFTANDLTRWAVKALIDDGSVADATESDIDSALEQGEVTVTVDGNELQQNSMAMDDSAAAWSNAETVGFDSVQVQTAAAEDSAADSFTRTITYELQRSVYLDAKDDFDTFFEESTPEGGELTPAGEADTTWVIAFPAGTAEQVATWTDTALATTGSTFSVEVAPSAEDAFAIETRVVDSIDCVVACGETGTLTQTLLLPAAGEGAAEEVALDGGPEPQVITDEIVFTSAVYDVTVNRDGGGEVTMELSLPVADDEVVTEENVVAFLGEGAERSESDDMATYTLHAEAADAEEFPGALQKLGFEGADGPPLASVSDSEDGTYVVSLQMGVNGELYDKLGSDATWTIHGDGLRPTSVIADDMGTASLGEEAITAEGEHGVLLTFSAERTGLGGGAIVVIVVLLAVLGLLIAMAVIAFLYRGKIAEMLRGTPDPEPVGPSVPAAETTPGAGETPGPGGPQGPPHGSSS